MKRKVVIASTGSIAILSVPNLIMLMRRAFSCSVAPILSEAATTFITPLAIGAVAGTCPIAGRSIDYTDLQIEEFIENSQVYVIAPATANCIAELANGLYVSLPSRGAAMFSGPIIIAPAMNEAMWNNPATIRNVSILSQCGFHIVGPSAGLEVATYEPSKSSMSSIDVIAEKIISVAPLNF